MSSDFPAARFLTPPVVYDWEVRGFFRDPDGHLLEIKRDEGARLK